MRTADNIPCSIRRTGRPPACMVSSGAVLCLSRPLCPLPPAPLATDHPGVWAPTAADWYRAHRGGVVSSTFPLKRSCHMGQERYNCDGEADR